MKTNRWILVAIGITASFLTGPLTLDAASRRPNVLFITTDQQHAGMLSCAGNPYLKTPALDGLAAGGVRFERAYCANPVCVPSRFSMMTGVLPSHIGMEHNGQISNPVPPGIFQHAMGNVFRAAGYQTVYGGKVHLPSARKGNEAYGFQEYLTGDERDGLVDACAEFFKRKHDKPFLLVASLINPHDICFMAIDAFGRSRGGPPAYPKSTRERQCLAEAMRLPEGVSREEFFKRICPPLPANHEIPPGEPSAARSSDARSFRVYVQNNWTAEDWRLHRWAYARLTERVDAEIGRLLAALRAAGLENDTIIVFTSDHGDMDASHKLEHKSMPYEEATHVPFVVSFKGTIPGGHVDKSHFVSTGLDLIPTLCDLAGVPVPATLSGRSVKPLAMDQTPTPAWRDTLVVENEKCRILRTARFKYAVYDRGERREMLVDLENDPGEMHNLALEPAHHDDLVRHRKLLKEWYQKNGEKLDERYIISDNPAGPAAAGQKKPYTLAVYYWPNFHQDAFHQSKLGQGWTEWEIVKHGKPRFPGHEQPKVPLWGYRDESDPKEMARSIDAMADAGIGAVIFDWYRYEDQINDGQMIEAALKRGFLQAPNRNRIKFSLMWANHTYIDCHPFKPGYNFGNAPVWRKAEVSREAFDRHTGDAIKTYFSQPNYWKIDGKPYFSIYHLPTMLKGLGGLAPTRAAFDGFRARVKAAGFADLHLNVVDFSLESQSLKLVKGQPTPDDPSRKVETVQDMLTALKIDSATPYTWVHHTTPAPAGAKKPGAPPAAEKKEEVRGPLADSMLMESAAKAGVVVVDYVDYGTRAMRFQQNRGAQLGATYFPHVSVGWDGSPRNYTSGIVVNTTPENFKLFLQKAKEWMDAHPESKNVLTINSWNEWVEGSYLEPDVKHGTKYLDTIREIFGPQ